MSEAFEVDDLDVGEAVARRRAAVLTQRLRWLALACMTVIGTLVVTSVLAGEILPTIYNPLRLCGFVCLVVFVALSYRPGFAERQELWGWMLVASVGALAAVGGALRRNPATSAILEAMLVLLTSAVLPWGWKVQAASAGACALFLLALAWSLGPYPPGDPDLAVVVDAMTAFFLSLFVAHGVRSSFDEAAEENLRLKAARSRIRSFADELEAKVKSRTAELEATLADQRSMTRAISHDLRQPLRHISGFTQMLTDDLSGKLSDEHREQMARVCTATARMDRMVEAMLEISRVAGKPLEPRRIDLTGMTRELGETLARSEPDREVKLTVDEGLCVDGDPGLVRNMMHELLANAWKFTRASLAASVEVGRRGDVLFVRDNGSGFDMQHASKMFGAFERLHHRDEFDGEGVGLAIAERVARRHGGRIWAESQPGRGTTIYFTLHPAA